VADRNDEYRGSLHHTGGPAQIEAAMDDLAERVLGMCMRAEEARYEGCIR
jgi:hypothetical protein